MSDYLSTLGDVMASAAGFAGIVFGALLVVIGGVAAAVEEQVRYLLFCPLGFLVACAGGAWLLYVMRYW